MAGENLSLAYATDAVVSTKARCVGFAYGFSVVATESHAREHRAMYPHQRALGKFRVDCQFKTYAEYQAFMNFFLEYAHSWLHPPTARPYYSPGITATLTSDDLTYKESFMGVPIAGITNGDHVGNIAYPQSILFQIIRDPLDPQNLFTGNDDQANPISYAVMGDNYHNNNGQKDNADDTTKFFYPFSPGSEDASVKATDIYGIGPAVASPPAAGTGGTPSLGSQFWDVYQRANPGSASVTGLPGS